jgi:hypothetical protein
MGSPGWGPDAPIREDELAVVPLLQLGLSSGTFDLVWLTRLGRAHAESLRLLATAWTEAYQARFEGPLLQSGAAQRTAMELAAQLSGDFLPLGDPALLGIYRRRQEVSWTEHAVGCYLLARRCSELGQFGLTASRMAATKSTLLSGPRSDATWENGVPHSGSWWFHGKWLMACGRP